MADKSEVAEDFVAVVDASVDFFLGILISLDFSSFLLDSSFSCTWSNFRFLLAATCACVFSKRCFKRDLTSKAGAGGDLFGEVVVSSFAASCASSESSESLITRLFPGMVL